MLGNAYCSNSAPSHAAKRSARCCLAAEAAQHDTAFGMQRRDEDVNGITNGRDMDEKDQHRKPGNGGQGKMRRVRVDVKMVIVCTRS